MASALPKVMVSRCINTLLLAQGAAGLPLGEPNSEKGVTVLRPRGNPARLAEFAMGGNKYPGSVVSTMTGTQTHRIDRSFQLQETGHEVVIVDRVHCARTQ